MPTRKIQILNNIIPIDGTFGQSGNAAVANVVGDKLTNDYVIQASITEVSL